MREYCNLLSKGLVEMEEPAEEEEEIPPEVREFSVTEWVLTLNSSVRGPGGDSPRGEGIFSYARGIFFSLAIPSSHRAWWRFRKGQMKMKSFQVLTKITQRDFFV